MGARNLRPHCSASRCVQQNKRVRSGTWCDAFRLSRHRSQESLEAVGSGAAVASEGPWAHCRWLRPAKPRGQKEGKVKLKDRSHLQPWEVEVGQHEWQKQGLDDEKIGTGPHSQPAVDGFSTGMAMQNFLFGRCRWAALQRFGWSLADPHGWQWRLGPCKEQSCIAAYPSNVKPAADGRNCLTKTSRATWTAMLIARRKVPDNTLAVWTPQALFFSFSFSLSPQGLHATHCLQCWQSRGTWPLALVVPCLQSLNAIVVSRIQGWAFVVLYTSIWLSDCPATQGISAFQYKTFSILKKRCCKSILGLRWSGVWHDGFYSFVAVYYFQCWSTYISAMSLPASVSNKATVNFYIVILLYRLVGFVHSWVVSIAILW